MPYLPPMRLTGATILREGELRQRSVAISRGRISKGPLPGVDMDGYLILPGIVDLLFAAPAGTEPALRLRNATTTAARAGITTAWITPSWGWDASHNSPEAAEALLRAVRPGRAPDLRMGLRIESYRTDSTQALVDLAQSLRLELAWFESDFARLQELQRHDSDQFQTEAAQLGVDPEVLSQALEGAAERRREVPRHLCRLAEGFDDIRARYGSIGDTGGAMRETHSMIGAGLAACPIAHSAAAAARAMGDPVLLSAQQEDRLRDLLRGGLGDAIVSDGAPDRLVPLAMSLAGPDLAGLPRIWSLLSSRPADIMRLADRGRLDHGCRADLVIVSRSTGAVEVTISDGQLTHLSGEARERFLQASLSPVRGGDMLRIAAE
ncbi:amidohydrolase family protein [Paracoccus laeviglucosivorans]|uniref:Alpha-D-ribose 1-methylphosphonate 5-triphosphate diphosphatase n=1 Tax=Paracoccus laeviglucosivorans TaxID=1197861 RepID=A0A521ACM2_9RHOB|nr:amidohydrolase family protein [Paracoccus laeviglucosivorans]SMO32559.1 alpha-D-ribose 1-methylphosphonate 5-triphosphate diphosphatase [Paracoccus laeviglucosivorans]